ncbi:MAG: 3-deoxy-D-manno-octulosonic acid transferase [Candidatus Omnitrophica bacterium]|nr:3-deoxy-D-manno-octulosonic acid transferase [Candidatus Omnitrophota bacterium]
MTVLYNIIFVIFAVFYLPYLIFTGRYHRDISQRFGFYPKGIYEAVKGKGIVWVHAVSVGEVRASRVLCERLIEKFPDKRLIISTITRTGNDTAKRLFGDKATVLYLPVDISFVVKSAIDRLRPDVFIIVETEIWPNLITALRKKDIPIVMVNGRVSPKSYRRYMWIRPLLKDVLKDITLYLMQTEEYADRIIKMGAPPKKVIVTGNMKFDAAGREYASGKLNPGAIRNDLSLKDGELLFIAGSTHRPEEEMVLRVYREIIKEIPKTRLLIAPRHTERSHEIEALIKRFNFVPVRISGIAGEERITPKGKEKVLLLDTMGRLSQLFSIADIVFMGGSLMRKGGQNILEPATFSRPIIFGPHMFNFKDIAESFLNAGAACSVRDTKGLLETANRLLTDGDRRKELGKRARSMVDKNAGATLRNIEKIDKVLS